MKKQKQNYIMLEAYLNNNLGDDLFIHVLANRYPKQIFCIFSQCGDEVVFPDNVVNAFGKIDTILKKISDSFWWKIRRLTGITINQKNTCFGRYISKKEKKITNQAKECVLITGSGFIETDHCWNTDYFHNEFDYYARNPILLGCNFGPYKTKKYKEEYRKLFKLAKDVCFRDNYSKSMFNDLPNTRCEMDIVFNYTLGESLIFEGQAEKKYILISVVDPYKEVEICASNMNYINFLKNCIYYYVQRDFDVVFVGFCKNQKDDKIIEKIIEEINTDIGIHIFNYPDITYKEVMGLFKYADSVVASRYHAMIIAMLYEKKVYPIAYSEKMVHVLKDIDENAHIALVEDLERLSAEEFVTNYGYQISKQRLSEVKESANKQFFYLDKLLNDNR